MAKRGSEAAARQQRGELDPEGEAARARLHEIVARQQELGLLKEAGTADLLRAASGRGAGLRGGRVVRPGRQAGRGVVSVYIYLHISDIKQCQQLCAQEVCLRMVPGTEKLKNIVGPGRGRGFAGDNGHGRGQKRSADFPERDEGASKQPRLDALALSPPGGVDGNALDVRLLRCLRAWSIFIRLQNLHISLTDLDCRSSGRCSDLQHTTTQGPALPGKA